MKESERVSKTIGIALLATSVVVLTAAALVLAIDFVLLIFLAILFGVFLTKTSSLISGRTNLKYGGSLAIVVTTLVLLTIGSFITFGVKIEQQLDETSAQLDKSSEKINQWLDEHPLLENTFRKVPFSSEVFPDELNEDDGPDSLADHLQQELAGQPKPAKSENAKSGDREDGVSPNDRSKQPASAGENNSSEIAGDRANNATSADQESDGGDADSEMIKTAAGKVFAGLGRLLSTTLGAIANIGIVFFMGVFIAIDPTLYRDGVVWLFPKDKRDRVTEVLNKVSDSMFKWLNGRFLAMLITGGGTAIALMILGVPMAITVGVITGLLTFVPNIGAIIALVIAMLLALTVSPMTVVWVVVIYAGLQLVESNVITPIVQQRQTSIPPALLIGFQIIMGALTGFLGVMVATPLLAASMVFVKELWIKDTLHDDSFDEDEKGKEPGADNGNESSPTEWADQNAGSIPALTSRSNGDCH